MRRSRAIRGALALVCAAIVAITTFQIPVGAQQPVTLNFVVWEYLTPTIRKFADQFEAENPGIKVNLTVFPTAQYAQKVQLMVTGHTPFDALYVLDDYLGQWSSWLEPLDGYPGIPRLANQLNPLAKNSATYQGKLYGLPYYVGFVALTYNAHMLQAAGIQQPPTTWDQLVQQSLLLKQKGLSQYPLVFPGNAAAVGPMWTLFSMIASRGGTLFDQNMNLTPIAKDTLTWLARAANQWKIVSPKIVELDSDGSFRAFMDGTSAFYIGGNWYVGPLWANNPEKSKIVGQVKQALMPGNGHTVGYARLYSVTKFSQNKDAAVKLVRFFGGTDEKGEFLTAKEWVFQNALTWGYPSVGRDPAVVQEVAKWGSINFIQDQLQRSVHISAIGPFREPWYPEWQNDAIGIFQQLINGQLSADAAAAQLSQKAKELSGK